MPSESIPAQNVEGYCRYCQWEGTVSVKTIHTILCPKCDMPIDYKVEPRDLKPNDCNAAHPNKQGMYCSRAKDHDGFHTDFKRMYSWPPDSKAASSPNLQQVRAEVTTEVVPCGGATKDGRSCRRPRGHIGVCYSGSYRYAPTGITATTEEHSPHIRGPVEPVERAGKGMITAKLKDGTVVAIEFKHEWKTKRGKRKLDPERGIAYRNKSKVLSGTEAKLYQLEERKDDDKPGVVVLAKALLNTAYVIPHIRDLRKGLAGGRRAALQRLLCEHDVDLAKARCRKCHIQQDAISGLASEPLSRDDRQRVWDAYWDATASVRVEVCGCVVKATVPGEVSTRPCASHEKSAEAA